MVMMTSARRRRVDVVMVSLFEICNLLRLPNMKAMNKALRLDLDLVKVLKLLKGEICNLNSIYIKPFLPRKICISDNKQVLKDRLTLALIISDEEGVMSRTIFCH
jgi:hypothetical protein